MVEQNNRKAHLYGHTLKGISILRALGTPQTPIPSSDFCPIGAEVKTRRCVFTMAIFHCSIKIISRSTGKSATSASAYRAGTKVYDDELGETFDYTKKRGVVFSEVLLCANAPQEFTDREKMWNSVQAIEKAKNSQLCREVEVALPVELSREEQVKLVREYIQENFTSKGMCADWALHDKGDGNPHAHILLTVRPIKSNGEWGAKRKDSYALDDQGNKIPVIDPNTGKQKIGSRGRKMWERISVPSTDWNERSKAEEWRKGWADACNKYLQGRVRVDHRSYARQGKKKLPTIHEGYIARKIEKRGKKSTIINYNAKVRRTNDYSQATEQGLQAVEAELKQLEAELEKLKSEQKGQKKNELNARIAELLGRGSRTDSQPISRSQTEVRTASKPIGTTEQSTESSDTDALIRQAEAVRASARADVADTRATIEQSSSKIASSTASRADREAERERQATLRSQQEAERRRAEEERKRRAIERSKRSLPSF